MRTAPLIEVHVSRDGRLAHLGGRLRRRAVPARRDVLQLASGRRPGGPGCPGTTDWRGGIYAEGWPCASGWR